VNGWQGDSGQVCVNVTAHLPPHSVPDAKIGVETN
jgi:hypothetical protein